MNKRINKGKSLIAFPESYVVIDIETTGLSPEYDSIIEVGAIRYSAGEIVEQFSSLVKPDCVYSDGKYINSYIEELTGITNEMLKSAPSAEVILPKYYEFIGDSLIVGHNVNFDINFLYDNFDHYINKTFSNNFIDTMRISKNLHPEASHHRLCDLLLNYSISQSDAHRVLADCQSAHSVLLSLANDAAALYGSKNAFLDYIKQKKTKKKELKAADIHAVSSEFDDTHPLYQKVCVFTGVLEKMVRRDAMQIVANMGGINGDSVTKKTNYLILGNNDYCKSIKDGKSSKQKKAEKLKLDGFDIEIIPEDVFYDMIED